MLSSLNLPLAKTPKPLDVNTLARQYSKGGMDAVKRVLKSEPPMRGDDGVKIREQIVEKVQIDQVCESWKPGESRT